jgi:molecular chaperone GrpE
VTQDERENPRSGPEPLGQSEPLGESEPLGQEADGAVEEAAPAPAPESPAHAPDEAYLRLAADFDNYRKRVAREQAELGQRANERLLNELLPVLDDLERALLAAEQHEEATLEEGVRLTHRTLLALLERQGLTEIETAGAFDPHVHEALLAQPAEDAAEGDVLQVLQKGYRLGDRVLRPARVIVAQ